MLALPDVVIPLIDNLSPHLELRFALRSLEYIPRGTIYVIGHKPNWLKNVVHIPFTEKASKQLKEKNLYDKLQAACKDERISQDFIYFHDDHFILPDFDINNYYCTDVWESFGNYQLTINNTKMTIGQTLNYDVHCPMLLNKTQFMQSLPVNLIWPAWGYLIKTTYAAFIKATPFNHGDLKFRRPLSSEQIRDSLTGRHFFSTEQNVVRSGAMVSVLKSLYPKPSRHE